MALTKVTGQVIKDTTDVTVGVLTVTSTLAVGGTVSIGGTLTYEDVTNVDAVGLITARNGIVVGSGITLSPDGDIFATGITTVSENVKVGSGITLSPDGDIFATGITTVSGNVKVGTGITLSPDGDIFATGITTVSGNVKVGSGITLSPDGDVFTTGVSTVSDKLFVNERVRVTGPSTITNMTQTIMAIDSADDNTIGLGGKIGLCGLVNGTPRTYAAVGGLKAADGTGHFGGQLALYTRRNNEGALDERLRIISDGKVGINTTSPTSTLDVKGSFTANGSFYQEDATTRGSDAQDKTVVFNRKGIFLMLISYSLGTTTSDVSRNVYSLGLFTSRSNGATWTAIQQDLTSTHVGNLTISDASSAGQLRIQKSSGSDSRICAFRIDVLSSADVAITVTDT